MARLAALPGWVVSNDVSVRREAEPYRRMSPAERLALGAAASRAAWEVVMSTPRRDVALAYRDPIPPSTVAALERLRREHRSVTRDGA